MSAERLVQDRARPGPEDGRPAGAPGPRHATTGRALRVTAGLWLVFCVLHYALSGRFWLWLLVDLIPPVFFVAVPAVLLALALVLRTATRRLVLATVTAVAVTLPLLGVQLAGPRPGAGHREVRVVSWNTEYWDQDDDHGGFIGFLRSQRADVYLLQEYIHFDQSEQRVTRIDEVSRLRAAFPGYHIVIRGELITLSRFPVVGQPLVPPDRYAADEDTEVGWQEQFERAKILRTDLRVDDRVVSFYNVHIPVQLDVARAPWRAAFYRAVREKAHNRNLQYAGLARELAGNRAPTFVAGDFNTTSAMGEMGRIPDRMTDAAAAGDSWYPVSWPAGGTALWRLDWAFTAGGLTARRYELVDPAGLSDHRLQRVLVSVAAAR
ncbi:endonuclease/exonuclease/phosphatase family protein [Micromonospora sp. WMMA1998]|uniref:endonuclease/exonuclease/phosphatase family protein n=1 Tax=Micromonospora sp. WMMA1998 TaxID=3015167 RepID=UPI00248B5B55|nr:endonuclease/exonuclease/phosphatase family protein [Micromonospora sp. WMMA1998]WBC14831.1 endonuclease/exonuclease/phosphatase family protein [Micromonospora sp. WMMA1998]